MQCRRKQFYKVQTYLSLVFGYWRCGIFALRKIITSVKELRQKWHRNNIVLINYVTVRLSPEQFSLNFLKNIYEMLFGRGSYLYTSQILNSFSMVFVRQNLFLKLIFQYILAEFESLRKLTTYSIFFGILIRFKTFLPIFFS